MRGWTIAFASVALCLALMCGLPSAAMAVQVQQVVGSSGVKAWLVEDHKLPVVAISFAFRGGVEQDQPAKQGLATMMTGLLTEGAGDLDAIAFQKHLADRNITMDFKAERDALLGSMKCLAQDKDAAFSLLALALTKPRFDTADLERERAQQQAAIRAQFANPEWQSRYALLQSLFGRHPYGQRRLGTLKTVSALTRDDVKNFADNHLARDNLVVSVAGDMTAGEVAAVLDRVFGDLPRKAHLAKIPAAGWPGKAVQIVVPREGTQTAVMFALPAPRQDDADWYPAEIANYIFGGGGFSSRLMQEVRDKKGLTYGIDTGLSPSEHASLMVGSMASDNPKTREAWDIVLATLQRFYEDGVTAKEIDAAKDYMTGSLPLALTSTDRIAGVLTQMQLEHRPPHYLDIRNDLIRKVTPEQVNNAIHRWFNPAVLVSAMTGRPEGMASAETRQLVRE